jgi:hypothetical protein
MDVNEWVARRRVVVVEVAHEVLEEDQRNAAGGAESAIGEADAVRLDELGRDGVVCVGGPAYRSVEQKR